MPQSDQIKEIDDLEIVTCPVCLASKLLKYQCRNCNRTGTVVARKEKFYEWRDKRER